jgi:hypothetical protein
VGEKRRGGLGEEEKNMNNKKMKRGGDEKEGKLTE